MYWVISRMSAGDFVFEGRHYAKGHAGMEGQSVLWYLSYMWQTGGILYIAGVIGIIRGIFSRSKEIFLISIFPILFLLLVLKSGMSERSCH